MKPKFISAHMKVAETYAQLSSSTRLKVCAIIVKDNRIISIGYNGTPSGWDNVCEYEDKDEQLITKSEVLHAESNALMKLARTTGDAEDAVVFITHAPCLECAKLIYQAGIAEVYYKDVYRSKDGIRFLLEANINIQQAS